MLTLAFLNILSCNITRQPVRGFYLVWGDLLQFSLWCFYYQLCDVILLHSKERFPSPKHSAPRRPVCATCCSFPRSSTGNHHGYSVCSRFSWSRFLINTMTQQHLTALAMLSMENRNTLTPKKGSLRALLLTRKKNKKTKTNQRHKHTHKQNTSFRNILDIRKCAHVYQ